MPGAEFEAADHVHSDPVHYPTADEADRCRQAVFARSRSHRYKLAKEMAGYRENPG